MQYFKPEDPQQWVGDCMPFYHDGLFHFYYLIDEGHHSALGGLGGHQWAHASSRDLVHWTHHPLALAISEEEEKSICTGSVYYHGDDHGGIFYAIHAVRRPDWAQRLGIATSSDGITFTKQPVPPYAEPPAAYDPLHFRDPCIFYNEQDRLFHMLVTAKYEELPIPALGGCLAHLTSSDLEQWQIQTPFIFPGFSDVPECPDYFEWNGWYYLIFSNHGLARYRMARNPLGPWQRPRQELLDGPFARVMKTAAYHDNRRLGVAWIGTRAGDVDGGRFQWGGHAVFRELVQLPDGTLGTKFPAEMMPAQAVQPLSLQVAGQSAGVTVEPDNIRLQAGEGMAALAFAGLPRNLHIHLTGRLLEPETPRFGLRLRERAPFGDGITLDLLPQAQRIELHGIEVQGATLDPVEGLDGPYELDIILRDDLVDLCLNGRYCLINRFPQQGGDGLTLFCHGGALHIDGFTVTALL